MNQSFGGIRLSNPSDSVWLIPRIIISSWENTLLNELRISKCATRSLSKISHSFVSTCCPIPPPIPLPNTVLNHHMYYPIYTISIRFSTDLLTSKRTYSAILISLESAELSYNEEDRGHSNHISHLTWN